VVGHVYRTGATYARRGKGDPHFSSIVDQAAGFTTRSLIAAPLHLERTVCGVLELVNRKGKRDYSAHDVALAELVAGYVSRAILNAVDIVKQNELALRDELTGLGNVRGLDPMLVEEVRSAEKRHGDVAVLFLDVDLLKKLNDEHGHRAGSEALRRLGGAVAVSLGDRGRAFRFGGDEFVVVCPRHEMAVAEVLAEDLRTAIAGATPGPMRSGGRLPALTVSVGIATLRASIAARGPTDPESLAERLLAAADHALYRAKRAGRDRVVRANRRDDRLSYEG
jgi:diguanylate cyclase (GGDEF)-like protein